MLDAEKDRSVHIRAHVGRNIEAQLLVCSLPAEGKDSMCLKFAKAIHYCPSGHEAEITFTDHQAVVFPNTRPVPLPPARPPIVLAADSNRDHR